MSEVIRSIVGVAEALESFGGLVLDLGIGHFEVILQSSEQLVELLRAHLELRRSYRMDEMAAPNSNDLTSLPLVQILIFDSLNDSFEHCHVVGVIRDNFWDSVLVAELIIVKLEALLVLAVLDDPSLGQTQSLKRFFEHFSPVDDGVTAQSNQDFADSVDGSVTHVESFAEALLDKRNEN